MSEVSTSGQPGSQEGPAGDPPAYGGPTPAQRRSRVPSFGLRGRLRALTLRLESSLASPEAAARWASEQPAGLRRATTTTLVERAVRNPELTGRLIRRNLPAGLEYLGVGYHSVVYRSADGSVLKVNRHSIHVSEQRRGQIAEAERRAHEVVAAHLGHLPIAQDIVVGPHPASPRLRAVMIVQAYCHYVALDDVFPVGHDSVDVAAVARLVEEHPGTREELRLLARGGLAMADQEQLVPDVCGRGNVGLVLTPSPRLVLVDRQPMRVSNRHARAVVVPQLTSLLQAVGGAADDLGDGPAQVGATSGAA